MLSVPASVTSVSVSLGRLQWTVGSGLPTATHGSVVEPPYAIGTSVGRAAIQSELAALFRAL